MVNQEHSEIIKECENLIIQSSMFVKLAVKNVTINRDDIEKEKIIETIGMLIKDIKKFHSDLEDLNKLGENVKYDDLNNMDDLLKLGDLYSKWMYNYAVDVLSKIDYLRSVMFLTEENSENSVN